MVIYTLAKFGADWLIFVDARVLTRKLWTDRQRWTVSDHKSSLSTPCSGEPKISFSPFPRIFSKAFFLNALNSLPHIQEEDW